jgi:hypothetical protein
VWPTCYVVVGNTAPPPTMSSCSDANPQSMGDGYQSA